LEQTVHSSNHTARLKSQLVSAAVQENADTIADRVPAPLRPVRRWLALGAYWTRQTVMPAAIVMAMIVIARWSTAGESGVVRTANASSPPLATAPPPSPPDMSLLDRPLPPRALQLGVRRIVLDAGHGGVHDGTASASGLLEKDITLDLAERARRLLIDRGFEVVMTRTTDATLSLKERATTANQQLGDIFVSIHLNALGAETAHGVETFYLGPSEHPEHDKVAEAENEHSGYSLADLRTQLDRIYVDARRDESKRLAQSVQDAVVRRLRRTDPSLDDRGVKTAPFVVLVATEMPAILAEVSCLSNPDEADRLGTSKHRQTVAEALVSGILAFSKQEVHSTEKRKDTNER
jgi:N-acetylmuramoyl-L-alanine amidase